MENSTENTTELTIKDEKSNSKIRNPFPWIGKVFKYEMKHSMRILLPVYAAVIAIALLAGILTASKSALNGAENQNNNFNFTYTLNGINGTLSEATGFAMFLFIIIVIASAVVSIIILVKRFKNGLLGDEAYLNLSLPVTIGEHLWGRIFHIYIWSFAYIITMIISLLLISFSSWKDIFSHFDSNALHAFFGIMLFILFGSLALILFIFLINSIGHLAKRHRTLVKLISLILILSITSRIIGGIDYAFFQKTNNSIGVFYLMSLFGAILSVIYGTATYFILKLKLNLE